MAPQRGGVALSDALIPPVPAPRSEALAHARLKLAVAPAGPAPLAPTLMAATAAACAALMAAAAVILGAPTLGAPSTAVMPAVSHIAG
ncbi:hypothetical protein BH09PSE2_BH09PSE2_14620 [soil metagenome]